MGRSKAEDAGGRLPARPARFVKDDNEAVPHFNRRTLRFFNCGNYTKEHRPFQQYITNF